MRGKGEQMDFNESMNRITPAYAGKSISIFQKVNHNGDHPRVCGEKTKKIP